MKIAKKMLLGFAVVILLSAVMGTVGVVGMNKLRAASVLMYDNEVLELEYIGKTEAAFKQMRIDCRQVIICGLYDDAKGAADAKDDYYKSVNEFTYWLEKCVEISADDSLSVFYRRITEIFTDEYTPKANLLIETSIHDMPDHVDKLYINALLASLIDAGERMENLIIGSIDLNVALAARANHTNENTTNFFIRLQVYCLAAAITSAIIVALYITRSISVPINESAGVLSKIAGGDFNARITGKYKGELAVLQSSVNDMAQRLSTYVKEKLQEDKIRELAAIMDIADAGIIIKDKDGIVRQWNLGAENLLGYKPEEIIGNPTHFYAPQESHADIDKTESRLKKGEHIAHVEVVRKHKDGRLIDCSASYTPIFDGEGNYNGLVAIFHDITKEKLAEENERSLAAIVAATDVGIITTDKDLVIVGWNLGAEKILGYPADEIIGNTAAYYSPEEEHSKNNDVDTRLRKGEHVVRTDVVRKHKDGTLIDCSVYYTPYFDEQGCFEGVVAIIHDISDIKRMEQNLQEAVRAAEEASQVKSTFLANMSHEIRTPMNAVISMTELLLEEEITPGQREYLTDIKTSGRNLLGIINDILDFSKIESGKFEITLVHFDMAEIMANMQSTFAFVTREKNLQFEAHTDANMPRYLYGDDIRIRQILTNLLSNAVKFTSEGMVSMKAWADDDSIYFDISDTGIGIEKENIDKLFSSFQQLDAAANRKKTGTGLGLSITKSLIEMMGGTISVDSEYGVGSTFHVKLPRVDGDPAQIEKDYGWGSHTLYAPEALVLVVDDYAANLRVATGLLGLSGIQCDIADNGETALEMIEQKNYDLVFMDHMMPGMDGVEVTQRIRQMGGDKESLPVIALTANALSGVKDMLVSQGMNDFLSKPIDRKLLNEILIKWLPSDKVRIEKTASSAAAPSAFRQKLSAAVPELNSESALEKMGGAEDLYEDTFRIMCRMLPANIAKMDELLSCDMPGFAIEVHGLKGALNNIGYDELARPAAQLENAAKANDEAFCQEHYGGFRSRAMEFYDKAARLFEEERQDAGEAGDRALLFVRLGEVRTACEEYDSIAASDILAELCRSSFTPEIDALLAKTARSIENCDYESGLNLIEQLEAMK